MATNCDKKNSKDLLGAAVGSRRGDPVNGGTPRLQRIAEVMEREHITPRTMAKRMGMTEGQVRQGVNPTRDLRLSELYAWQEALDVPIEDLLVDPSSGLSETVRVRASLLKVMRTAKTIHERTKSEPLQVLSTQILQQLIEVMPELKEVPGWPTVGQPRTRDEIGSVAHSELPERLFYGHASDC